MKTKGSRNKKGVKRILTKYGYIEIFEPCHPIAKKNGYVLEHRMMAWDAGILTDPSMEVHHINEIKTDNRLDNFKILPKPKHTSITWSGKKRAPWNQERRIAKSNQMRGNKNWSGNILAFGKDEEPRSGGMKKGKKETSKS